MWAPAANYLTDSIPGYIFNIVPLNNDTMPASPRYPAAFTTLLPQHYQVNINSQQDDDLKVGNQ
jgi:hypothetical protein